MLNHRWYIFSYISQNRQFLPLFFFFLLHFALGNPVDEKKNPPKLNGNMNTFTFNAVYNLSLWWVETSLNILAVISFEKINLACNSF